MSQTELLKGTLDLLILRTLELAPRHGIDIADRIAQVTGGTFVVKAGSLFPALHRLEERGFIRGRWTTSAAGRRVKMCELTAEGRRQLTHELDQWARVVLGVTQVLQAED